MEIISNKEEMIFKSEYNDRPIYRIGLSKKDKDGNYIKGYMTCNFKKDVELDNMTKIKIKSAWLDFYKKDIQTIPVIFINEFEIVRDEVNQLNTKTDFDKNGQIDITDKDLSMFDNENIEMPF